MSGFVSIPLYIFCASFPHYKRILIQIILNFLALSKEARSGDAYGMHTRSIGNALAMLLDALETHWRRIGDALGTH